MDIEKKLEERKYEVMSEPKQTWGQFIFRALLGLLLIGGALYFLTGCATTEVLPGLCYDDKNLTHLCEIEPEVKECIIKGECKYA